MQVHVEVERAAQALHEGDGPWLGGPVAALPPSSARRLRQRARATAPAIPIDVIEAERELFKGAHRSVQQGTQGMLDQL
jgi:hypothetical protein